MKRVQPSRLYDIVLRLAVASAWVLVSTPKVSLFAAERVTKPNILLLLIDNVGYGDLACYGNKRVKTPNIDRLASEGVRCTDFYIASPSCSPSRGALLSGRHPERNGLNYQLAKGEAGGTEGLPVTEKLIPQYLKPLGYTSGAFGKWNIGFSSGKHPSERGFDEFLGHMSGNIHYFKYLYHGENDLRRGIEPVNMQGRYSTDLFADEAIDFMRRHMDRPFFVYLPFNATHYVWSHNVEPGEKVEWQVPAKYLEMYGCPPDEPDQTKRFLAVLTALDDAIGRVLKSVDDLKLREKTIVLLISDNGAFMLSGRGLEVQSNKPLRDGGVTTYEGGIRVPAMLRWPERIKPATVCHEMLSSLDVLPLILSAAGAELPTDRVIDGRDPIKTLAGETSSPHEELHWVWNAGQRAQWKGMRFGKYKLLRHLDNEPWQLFDLSADIGETKDLAKPQPDVVKALAARFESWQSSVKNDPTRSRSVREP
jgi:arylsulfatase A-like enzyme